MRGIGRKWHVRPYTVPASEYKGLEHRSCSVLGVIVIVGLLIAAVKPQQWLTRKQLGDVGDTLGGWEWGEKRHPKKRHPKKRPTPATPSPSTKRHPSGLSLDLGYEP